MTYKAVCEHAECDSSAREDLLSHLLLASSRGCRGSFEELYRLTSCQTFGIVLRIIRRRAEAEEVLQDIYFKVWARSDQFDPLRGLAIYWLASIARRAAIDFLRRSSCRPIELGIALEDADPYTEMASHDASPIDVLEQTQRIRDLVRQLSSLPLEQQECLSLAFFDGLSHSEIATKLSCPLGTIKARVRRGLMTMREPLYALR